MATVVGTGIAITDVHNVQDAVNNYSNVVLEKHFNFDLPPTNPTALAGYPNAMILVSKAVTISGAKDATIEKGTIPFYVNAPGASVTIQGLHFTGLTARGIVVCGANGLTIAKCKFEKVGLYASGSSAIDINTSGGVPTPANPGLPQNIFGRLVVTGNEIDMLGGTNTDNTLGITVFSVGLLPNNETDIYIVGNKIKNITEPAINLRHIGGRAVVEGNEIHTGSVSGQASPPEVIRAANDGSFVIAHNTIHSEWSDPQAVGIGVFSQISNNPPQNPPWTEKNAVVICNSVTMSPTPGTVFTALGLSAGIDVRGFASSNVVAHNKIRGSGRAALAVDFFKSGEPDSTTLIQNDVDGFHSSIDDIVIGPGVTNTLLIEQEGTIQNSGVGTVIVP